MSPGEGSVWCPEGDAPYVFIDPCRRLRRGRSEAAVIGIWAPSASWQPQQDAASHVPGSLALSLAAFAGLALLTTSPAGAQSALIPAVGKPVQASFAPGSFTAISDRTRTVAKTVTACTPRQLSATYTGVP